MFVGEQPGDHEDIEGKPFVGPAGRLLDEALEEAGIDRRGVYVTNAVKHFKWKPQGTRRLHQKPNAAEVNACRPWLDAEIAVVKPHIVVLLGATAAQGLLGRDFRVTLQRGQLIERPGLPPMMATVRGRPNVPARTTDCGVPPTATHTGSGSWTGRGHTPAFSSGARRRPDQVTRVDLRISSSSSSRSA
jgi:DNA polymerase